MRKNTYWLLAVLLILLVGVTVYVIQHETPTAQQFKKELTDANKLLKHSNNQPTETRKESRVSDDGKRPPPGETSESGYWHGDHWHKIATDPEKENENQKPAKRLGYYERIYKKYGIAPPPSGYAYRMSAPGILRLDEKGKPILYKKGEAVFDIVITTGFAPTYEQYQHYLELIRRRDEASRAGNDGRADQLNAEITQLKSNAQGDIPSVSASLAVPTHLAETAAAETDQKASEIMRQAYIDMGLGYMVK